MASLISPGVEVRIIDESFFFPGRVTTIPVIFIATAEEKTQIDGETPAFGTYESGILREVTSIRQSLELYGIPRFLQNADGEPFHGDARNEYGLDALNKFLEIGNRAYVLRANVNLDDSLTSIKALWQRKLSDSEDLLVQLIEEYIEEYNTINDLVPADNDYKVTVTQAELKVILEDALEDLFESYSFSSALFINDFMSDHTVAQSAFQDVVFDTSGNLTEDDGTFLENDTTVYGAQIEVFGNNNSTLINYEITVQGSDAQTYGDLITELETQLDGDATVEFVSGKLRIRSTFEGATSVVEITDTPPGTGQEPLFENLSFFLRLDDPVPGKGPSPLDRYDDGFATVVGTYEGLESLIDGWTDGAEVNDEFTSDEAGTLLISAGNQYDDTKEFRAHTSLGNNNAARNSEITARLQELINSPNTGIRNPDSLNYNVVTCPGYPATTDELIRLSQDMLEEVFVIGETPFDRAPTGLNGISTWATTQDRATYTGAAYWYPHGISSNLDGEDIMTSAASTALRVIAYNDAEQQVWWAPAGTQRGTCPHLSEIGYVSGTLGGPTTFVRHDIGLGERDSLYENPKNINPITFISGRGILVLGQKTVAPAVSARESINVERLIMFLRREIRRGMFPYLFEPNDQTTRDLVKSTADNFLLGLVNERALYDFASICDDSNNTPDRIDRKELWLDIAIKPTRAVEFIIVPIRIVSTGTDISTTSGVET